MLFSRLPAPNKSICRLRVVYSRDQSPLSSLESRLTISIFKPFLIKSLQPVAGGFVSVWQFPKAESRTAAAFDALYLAIMRYDTLEQANKTEKAIDQERLEQEKARTQAVRRELAEAECSRRRAYGARRQTEMHQDALRYARLNSYKRGETNLCRILAANRKPPAIE